MPYIQYNQPCFVTSLVFDIDRPDAFFAWSDANLPQPNWIAKNNQNCHAHMGYMLSAPVCTSHRAKQSIINYLAKIEQAYTLALGADRSYSRLMTKNPCNNTWETHISTVQTYELNYLADFVELQELKTNLKEVSGLGRNCIMFDNVRYWAYEAIREHLSIGFDSWYIEVLNVAINANNAFIEPLPYSEVKATAKSVARWVWRHHSEAHAKFIERQRAKGRIGGLKSNSSLGGKARSAKYSDLRQQALILRTQGRSYTQIAQTLKIGRRTVINWCNQVVQVQA